MTQYKQIIHVVVAILLGIHPSISKADDRPVGVVDVKAFWVKDKQADCQGQFSPPSIWDQASNIVYCVYRGTGPRYLQAITSTTGDPKNASTCLNTLGQGWTDLGYDETSRVWMCKKFVNYSSLGAGEEYVEDIGGKWPSDCEAGLTELWRTPRGNVRFCGSVVRLKK